MAGYICKMCGATNVEENAEGNISTCPYCGVLQTIPKYSTEEKYNLYAKAQELRQKGDFEQAMKICNELLGEDRTDSESYWLYFLCTYGIRYVDDAGEKVPTINRMQVKSALADENFKAARNYATNSQRPIFEREANAISVIQKRVQDIVAGEKPYDVFISYKRATADNERTEDSVLAGEIFRQLSREGFKVFFAEISLENKLGKEYEPYIYAALQSSKVMLVVGTSAENINAPWVKNEWSRFLDFSKDDEEKTLIPCIRKMNAIDLPDEFAHLQIMNMKDIGFISDLIRIIRKICKKYSNDSLNYSDDYILNMYENGTSEAYETIAGLYLEDGNYTEANRFARKALVLNDNRVKCLFYILFAKYKAKDTESLRKKIRESMEEELEQSDRNDIIFANLDKKEKLQRIVGRLYQNDAIAMLSKSNDNEAKKFSEQINSDIERMFKALQ